MLANLNPANFDATARAVFAYQSAHNPVFSQYLKLLGRSKIQIPFLPISFFKTHLVQTGIWKAETEFTSSGTTGQITSKHLVADLTLYEESFEKGFEQFYGNIEDWTILALLPSYLERDTSSLVYMVNSLVKKSNHPQSGFYLDGQQPDRPRLCSAVCNSH